MGQTIPDKLKPKRSVVSKTAEMKRAAPANQRNAGKQTGTSKQLWDSVNNTLHWARKWMWGAITIDFNTPTWINSSCAQTFRTHLSFQTWNMTDEHNRLMNFSHLIKTNKQTDVIKGDDKRTCTSLILAAFRVLLHNLLNRNYNPWIINNTTAKSLSDQAWWWLGCSGMCSFFCSFSWQRDWALVIVYSEQKGQSEGHILILLFLVHHLISMCRIK